MTIVEFVISTLLVIFLVEEIYAFLKYKYTWDLISNINNQYRVNEYAGRYHLKDIKNK